MDQPEFSFPTKFSFGTFTLSKKVSQKGDFPLINLMGRVDTPSASISINKKLIPECLGASGSVLTKQKIISALSA